MRPYCNLTSQSFGHTLSPAYPFLCTYPCWTPSSVLIKMPISKPESVSPAKQWQSLEKLSPGTRTQRIYANQLCHTGIKSGQFNRQIFTHEKLSICHYHFIRKDGACNEQKMEEAVLLASLFLQSKSTGWCILIRHSWWITLWTFLLLLLLPVMVIKQRHFLLSLWHTTVLIFSL